jgi:7,8-dihydro-6-hydroxymethylpterin-pyrophosphokinase
MLEPIVTAIALGSNLPSAFGGPADNLREALWRMSALGSVTAVSSFHTTGPVGYVDQPHPAMRERAFVLAPLAEIAPEMVHPGLGKSVTKMLTGLSE